VTRKPSHHRPRQQQHPINYPGVLALILGTGGTLGALILVWRGEIKGVAEWGLLIGNLITGACGLLGAYSNRGRATDPIPGAHPGSTIETTTTVTPPEPPEGP
jgi:hypothetical protein